MAEPQPTFIDDSEIDLETGALPPDDMDISTLRQHTHQMVSRWLSGVISDTATSTNRKEYSAQPSR